MPQSHRTSEGKISTPVKGNLKAREWELPKIVADLTIASPSIPQKTVTLPIRASAAANFAKQSASAQVTTTFDESTIQAKLGATSSSRWSRRSTSRSTG
jgi:hypothetical protein